MVGQTSLWAWLGGDLETLVERVERYAERYKPPAVYVTFSGGKDSVAALAAVAHSSLSRKVIVVYNEIVGNTHPRNVEQAYSVARRLLDLREEVVVETRSALRAVTARLLRLNALPALVHVRATNRHGGDFWDGVVRWGVPIVAPTGRRWCWAEHKDKWWRVLPSIDGRRYIVEGVKASDSPRRRSTWWGTGGVRVFELRDAINVALSPVYDMTDDEVWQLVKRLNVDLLTYRAVGSSLNCCFCPLRSREKQRRIVEWMKRDPESAPILERARWALSRIPRPRLGPVTREVARRWLEMLA